MGQSGGTRVEIGPGREQEISLNDFFASRKIVERYLRRTPFLSLPALNETAGMDLNIKYEHCHPIGSFKARGALVAFHALEGKKGIVTASTGNHGQGVAFAARKLAARATIVVPEGSNEGKVAAIRRLGATIVVYGSNVDESSLEAKRLAEETGDEPVMDGASLGLLLGAGSIGLEMLEEVPDLDVIVCPIGNGNLIAATSLVAKSINPRIKVIGVQTEEAPSMYLSFKQGAIVKEGTLNTFADGMATRMVPQLSFEIIRRHVDDIILVSEDEIKRALILYLTKAYLLTEGAGAAGLAGCVKLQPQLAGKKVATIITGCNLAVKTLENLLAGNNGVGGIRM